MRDKFETCAKILMAPAYGGTQSTLNDFDTFLQEIHA